MTSTISLRRPDSSCLAAGALRSLRYGRVALLGLLLSLTTSAPSAAVTFHVDGFLDRPDINVGDGKCEAVFFQTTFCSLRAAIQETNVAPVPPNSFNYIYVPAGTYTLSLQGVGADTPAVGDLDITSKVWIQAAGGVAVVDAQAIDRVLEISAPSSTVVLGSLHLTGGSAFDGGGIYLDQGTVSLIDVAVRGNQANQGGGLFIDNGLVLSSRTSIRDNVATVSGGGVFGGRLSAELTEITSNQAPTGSAVAVPSGGLAGLTSSTVSSNIGPGGAVYCEGEVSLRSATLHGNEGVALDFGPGCEAEVDASILSGGCSGAASELTDSGSNLESPGASCGLSPLTNVVNVADPALKPLAYYGGPTRGHALRSGSPARDLDGDCLDIHNEIEIDQREAPRSTPQCDAGALEFGAMSPLPGLFGDGFESGDLMAWE